MNNCLCESCCNKDYCLFYQDYKNPNGIIAEPITACGRYKKLHTIEDIYTKEEVIAMLTEIQLEIEESCISKWRAEGIIQQKINKLKEEK